MYCPDCGEWIRDDVDSCCPHCGEDLWDWEDYDYATWEEDEDCRWRHQYAEEQMNGRADL